MQIHSSSLTFQALSPPAASSVPKHAPALKIKELNRNIPDKEIQNKSGAAASYHAQTVEETNKPLSLVKSALFDEKLDFKTREALNAYVNVAQHSFIEQSSVISRIDYYI